jgi:hypothetical protein
VKRHHSRLSRLAAVSLLLTLREVKLGGPVHSGIERPCELSGASCVDGPRMQGLKGAWW